MEYIVTIESSRLIIILLADDAMRQEQIFSVFSSAKVNKDILQRC